MTTESSSKGGKAARFSAGVLAFVGAGSGAYWLYRTAHDFHPIDAYNFNPGQLDDGSVVWLLYQLLLAVRPDGYGETPPGRAAF